MRLGLGLFLAASAAAAPLDNGLVRAVVAGDRSVAITDLRTGAAVQLGREPYVLMGAGGKSADAAVAWRLELRPGSRYLRTIVDVTNRSAAPLPITEIRVYDCALPGAHAAGEVNGSPVVAGTIVLGVEHPLARNRAADDRVQAGLPRLQPLLPGQTEEVSGVIAFTDPGQLRRGFLDYLERERARPYQPFLLDSTWFDIGNFNHYTEKDLEGEINGVGSELVGKRGVHIDSFQLDDGWDDPGTLWQFHSGFPHGLDEARVAVGHWGASLGLWLSPWGGYGRPKKQRIQAGALQGFEVRNGSFSLAGPRYYARFRERCLNALQHDGVNYFKFDGIGTRQADEIDASSERDFEAMLRLVGELRAAQPNLFVNLTTGTWPSPFWLRYVDSTWRNGHDTGLAGVGSVMQRWMTYRDGQTFHNVVSRAPLYPLNSLMTHGVILAVRGERGLTADPGNDFAAQVWTYFASGTQLQEMYISSQLLTRRDWDALAAAARWSRSNADVMRDVHWVGGDPNLLQAYGWAAWTPRKGILAVRNPSDATATFRFDPASVFELPAAAPRRFRCVCVVPQSAEYPATLRAGVETTLRLAPFEVLVLEAVPAASSTGAASSRPLSPMDRRLSD